MTINFRPIGYFQTPHEDVRGMPIQPPGASGVHGSITVLPDFLEGLKDIEGFSYLIVLYHLHEITSQELTVTPFLDKTPHGIFATRSPSRPNPIGLSVLRLLDVKGDTLLLQNVDVLDGTPVIDIKPYVPDFDVWPAKRVGWFEGKSGNAAKMKSDARFANLNEVSVTEG